jgi:hypothetical protein
MREREREREREGERESVILTDGLECGPAFCLQGTLFTGQRERERKRGRDRER